MSGFISQPILPQYDKKKSQEDNWKELTRSIEIWSLSVVRSCNDAVQRDGSRTLKAVATTLTAGTVQFQDRALSMTINATFGGGSWKSHDTARPSWALTFDMSLDRGIMRHAAATTGNLTWVTYDQVPRPWAALKMSADQGVISGAAPAVVKFDTADGTGYASMANTANYRFVVPITGVYAVDVGLSWSNVALGARLARLWVGGVAMSPDRVCQVPGSASSWAFTGISVTKLFTANDQVSVAAQQDSGSPVSVLSGYSWFNMSFQGVGA
ncbi:MAG: hypothetical protein QME66_08235 [Candidatus Eisenbacteria bacterium]|nr:hypothetical protein [Candidatus Eisenbacteria bacterium]